jgi:hypothetical protein
MQTDSNLKNAESKKLPTAQQIGSAIPKNYAVDLNY